MSPKALANPLIRYLTKRGYAQVVPAIKEARITCGVLPSKTVITALDNGSPITRVTVAFKAGSRYEPQNELGIAHVLRSAAGLTTSKASSYIIQRKLAQIGASVTASGDREFIYYTLETSKTYLPIALEMLNNLISNQEFRQWELDDNKPRLLYDVAALPPQVRAVDLLHKTAYRRGLGNSLFVSPKRAGSFSSESLQHFACTNVTMIRCSVAVVGDTLEKGNLVAQALHLQAGCEPNDPPSKYHGGELRKETGGDLAHIVLALPGAPAGTQQALAFAIAAKALGNGPVTKWGSDSSPVAAAIGNIGPFAAAGFNVSYTDAGLFGIMLSVPKDEATGATKAIAKLLLNPCLSSNAIKAGKNQLKTQILSEADVGSSLSESLAAQGLITGNVRPPVDLAAAIDSITDNNVCEALASTAKCNLSMGAVGNLAFVPYVDELFRQ